MVRTSCLALAVVACLAASPVLGQTRTPVIGLTPTAYGPGDIRPAELRATAPHLGSLQVSQPEIRLRVGDTLSLDTLMVVAYDSTGARIGRLRMFDSHLPHGPLLPAGVRHYVAAAEGTVDLTLGFPRLMWVERSDRPAEVRVRVTVTP